MENEKKYKVVVHSPHFFQPVIIKAGVRRNQRMAAVLEEISRQATAQWLREYPSFFDNITAPDFYETISIIVSQEVENV